MKNEIIQRKIQVAMKTFVPPFFNHFNSSLNREKAFCNEGHEKKLNIFTLLLPIYCNIDWCKCEHCKNQGNSIRNKRNRLSLL